LRRWRGHAGQSDRAARAASDGYADIGAERSGERTALVDRKQRAHCHGKCGVDRHPNIGSDGRKHRNASSNGDADSRPNGDGDGDRDRDRDRESYADSNRYADIGTDTDVKPNISGVRLTNSDSSGLARERHRGRVLHLAVEGRRSRIPDRIPRPPIRRCRV
jgi:hypothetical protein